MIERRSVASFNLPDHLLDILDSLVAKRKYASKTQIVVEAVEEWFVNHGHIKPTEPPKIKPISITTSI